LGYYGVIDSGSNGTAVFIANQQPFESENLLVNVSFLFHNNEASTGFLIIDSAITAGSDTYNEYGIFASKDSDNPEGLNIWYNNITTGGETNPSLGSFDMIASSTEATFNDFSITGNASFSLQ